MPLAIDAASSASDFTGTIATLTWSHTCTGSNRALIVAINDCSNPGAITGVTYNGVAMTLVESLQATFSLVQLYALSNPDPGAHDIVATMGSAGDSHVGGAVSFTGAYQITSYLTGTVATATGTSSTPSVDVPSIAGEIAIDTISAIITVGTPTATVGADQTEQWGIDSSGLGSFGSSTEAGAGNKVMSWTLGGTIDAWGLIGVSVRPAPSIRMSSFALRHALDSDEDEGRFNELDVRNWL